MLDDVSLAAPVKCLMSGWQKYVLPLDVLDWIYK